MQNNNPPPPQSSAAQGNFNAQTTNFQENINKQDTPDRQKQKNQAQKTDQSDQKDDLYFYSPPAWYINLHMEDKVLMKSILTNRNYSRNLKFQKIQREYPLVE